VSDRIQVISVVVSVILLLAVLELVRRRKLTEEYSILWILGALALVVLSFRRDLLDWAAARLGVYYPPIVLLLVLIVMVFIASLCFSVIVSRQRQQIERLIEETAILAAELRQSRTRRATGDGRRATGDGRPATDDGRRATGDGRPATGDGIDVDHPR
jgi:hypothetical protein